MRFHSQHTRDSSLRRLTRANRWLMAGSVALAGLLTEVTANAFPSKSKASGSAKSHTSGRAPKRRAHAHKAPAKSLQAPAQAPQASPEAPVEPSSEAAPAQEAAPEPAPEAAPETRAEPEPAPEAAPEPEPEPEASAPVVSGGS